MLKLPVVNNCWWICFIFLEMKVGVYFFFNFYYLLKVSYYYILKLLFLFLSGSWEHPDFKATFFYKDLKSFPSCANVFLVTFVWHGLSLLLLHHQFQYTDELLSFCTIDLDIHTMDLSHQWYVFINISAKHIKINISQMQH